MMKSGEWFVVTSGENEGRIHMAGWMLSAMQVIDDRTGEPKWWSYAHCPRCSALVQADETDKAYGDRTWIHERWHAETDHPVPAEVAAKVTRP